MASDPHHTPCARHATTHAARAQAYKDGTFEKKPGGYNPAEADVEEPEGEEEEDAGAKAAAAAAPVVCLPL